jgi:hypothetical protein
MNPFTNQNDDEDIYAFQVRRMRSMPGYPDDDTELIRIATKHTTSVLDLSQSINAFIEYSNECPFPSALRESLAALRPPPPDKVEQWKKEGATFNPDFSASVIAVMNGKNSQLDYDRQRWEAIRQAVEKDLHPSRFPHSDPKCSCSSCAAVRHDREFWAEYLLWAKKCHPQEVQAIRAGRLPEPSHPEAYRLNWEDLPEKRREAIESEGRPSPPKVTQADIDRIKIEQQTNRKESQP